MDILRSKPTCGVKGIVVGNGLEFKSWTRLIVFHIARMNPIIVPSALRDRRGRLFSSLSLATSLGEGKL